MRLFWGLFVAPHSADDSVGEVAFVGSSGFASGLAFAAFLGEVGEVPWVLWTRGGARCGSRHQEQQVRTLPRGNPRRAPMQNGFDLCESLWLP